ncbi:hypothetical protein KTAU_09620 [Thermogemmatispora aurantia]|uniref:Uncharacterized protein n=1 Tax=Thermogemmatispora aurantia TaxID=2045279 RepID=A0A5J4JZ17_9CHLR|nr:hypothetical protein KTAU_09620 [Thermogemmatispora aurantia]
MIFFHSGKGKHRATNQPTDGRDVQTGITAIFSWEPLFDRFPNFPYSSDL